MSPFRPQGVQLAANKTKTMNLEVFSPAWDFFSRILLLTISDFPFIWNVNQFCSDPFECFFSLDFVHFVAVFASVLSSACFSTLFSTLNLILLFTSDLLIPAGRCGLLEKLL